MNIFLNGAITNEDIPVIYANDRGFLLSDGLFETIKSIKGNLLFFNQHYERLKNAADFLDIPLMFNCHTLQKFCHELLDSNDLNECVAAIRMTLSRGRSSRGINMPAISMPTLLITAVRYEDTSALLPIRLCMTSICRNEYSSLTSLKTLHYLEPIMTRKIAQKKGYNDGIMVNTKNQLVETSTANIFFVKCNMIITPPLQDGVLPGIMRQVVIDRCSQLNISLVECSLTVNDIASCDAGFLTNSLIGIQQIACVDHYVFSTEPHVLIQKIRHSHRRSDGSSV